METRKLANQEEIRLHNYHDVAKNPLFYNKAKANNTKFCPEGYITVLDSRDNKTKNVLSNDYYKMKYYTSITYNKVVVFDIRDNTNKQVPKEDFYKYDFYKSLNEGFVTIKDKITGERKRVTTNELIQNNKYESIFKGKVSVRDIRDNKNKWVLQEDFNKYSHYVHVTKKLISVVDILSRETSKVTLDEYNTNDNLVIITALKISIFDSNNILQYICNGNFNKICETHNLPISALSKSYKNKGRPIFTDITRKSSLTRITNKNQMQFYGWYAKSEKFI